MEARKLADSWHSGPRFNLKPALKNERAFSAGMLVATQGRCEICLKKPIPLCGETAVVPFVAHGEGGSKIAALRAAGCTVIREEKKSGTSRKGRTELDTLLDFVREGDTLVVTSIDRLARSSLNVTGLRGFT